MAKGIRSKVKKRFRTLKREVIKRGKERQDLIELSTTLQLQSEGKPWRKVQPKNAFLYPDDPSAVFPQYTKQALIDFRNDKIDFAGQEFIGARRKKVKDDLFSKYVQDIPEGDLEEVGEAIQTNNEEAPDQEGELDEVDLAAELEGMKLASKSQLKTQRRKMKMQMEMESNQLGGNTKKIAKKGDGKIACKKSRKIMKF